MPSPKRPVPDNPMVWKMRRGTEPIPADKRDPVRAARGIAWWVLGSLWFWTVLALLVL